MLHEYIFAHETISANLISSSRRRSPRVVLWRAWRQIPSVIASACRGLRSPHSAIMLLLVVAGLQFVAEAKNPGPCQFSVSTTSVNFGNVLINTIATQSISLKSTGSQSVTIKSANVTGAGFSVSGATFPVTLNSKQPLNLQVSFDPTVAGSAAGNLTIASNSATSSTASVALSGVGTTRQLTVGPGSMVFGNVLLNTTSAQTLTLISSGTAAVTVNSVALAGSGFYVSGATFPVTLKPGQTLSLQVGFSPTVAGSASGTTTVSSNSLTGSTTTVSLSGNGTNPTNPVLTLSTTTLSFGEDPVGTPVTLPITLTSTGTSAVTVTAASVAGSGFTLSGAALPVILDPTIAITIQVQFDPTAVGTASGTLSLSSNSTTGGTSVVNLSGNGTHQVNLTWNAPPDSPVPIVDYNIYRAAAGNSSYQLLSSSNQAVFMDLSVQANTTYTYYVTSVGNNGSESDPSNQVTVTVP